MSAQRGGAPTTMDPRPTEAEKKPEPIYEKLAIDECYIIERRARELLVACNVGGRVLLKIVPLPK